MSLFDEILDENRPPPTYDYPSADDNEENEDKCDETSKGEKDASNCGRNIISSSSAALFEADNGLKDRGDEDDLRVNDDLRTRLTQRSGVDSLARPRSTSRPSSREERPASAASSGDEGGRRPRSNGSSGSNGENGAPLLSKQVQRLAKLGVQLSKAPRLSAGAEIVDLSLPGEVPEKSEKSSALDRWFKSKFELKRKTTADRQQPAPISFNTNMAVKDASGATVIEKKVIVLKKSQGEQRQPMRGIEGHKMVKNELEAALARKRQAGLQQRKEWYEEDNPKSEAEESEEELTDEDDGEPDGADDRASATNELVDDEAVEENDGDEEDNDDDDYAPESTPRLAADEPTPKIKSAQSVTADSQPFCLRLDSEPDTLEINNDELDAVDATTEHSTIVYDNGESDISSANLVKKQISTADFFDDDEGDANLDGTEKQSPARPRFLRPTSPSAKEDASKQQSAGIAQAATEFPLIGCSTPARPSNSKQSNGMFVASHESLDNADSQAFMSVDLHLPESLSQWAADTSNDASLISNQPGDATNEEVTTSDADSVPSQLLGLCSGKFSTNTLTPAAASLHTARTNSVDSDLLRLCSGVFPDDDATQHASPSIHGTHPIAKTPMETSDTNDTNDELGNVSDASDVTMKEGNESNKSKSSASSTSSRRKVLVKRRRKRAVLSDSEDEEEEEKEDNIDSVNNDGSEAAPYVDGEAEDDEEGDEEAEDEEGDEEDDEDKENADDDARNLSDDEVAVFRRLEQGENKRTTMLDKNKKLRRDFYDEEAELSGSDVGSGDEDLGSDQDVYEAEEGDMDQVPDEEELREQVNRAFLKQQHDEDKRNVLLYQEALLPDGDLHDGSDQNRRFRWRQREEEDALNAGLGDDLLPVAEQVDVDVPAEDADAGRVQLIKWRASQDDADDSNDEAESDSQLLKMGQIAIQRQISSSSVDVAVAVTSSRSVLGGTSFLKRDATTLSLLSKGTSQSGAATTKTATNTLFLCVAATDNGGVKRPAAADCSQSKQPLAAKRPKPSSADSIFRHFVN